jgi:hypothetical protein
LRSGFEKLIPKRTRRRAEGGGREKRIYRSERVDRKGLKGRGVATSFPGLQCEDEGRDEEALVWAGHVHVYPKNGSISQLLVKEWRDIL